MGAMLGGGRERMMTVTVMYTYLPIVERSHTLYGLIPVRISQFTLYYYSFAFHIIHCSLRVKSHYLSGVLEIRSASTYTTYQRI